MTDRTEWPSSAGPVLYDIKVVYTSDDANENGSASATAQFTVTVVDACYYNELTCTALPDIDFLINADGTSPGAASQASVSCAFTGGLSASECPLTQTLQSFDESTNVWSAYTTDQLKPVDGGGSPTASCTYGDATCVYQYDFDNTGGAYNAPLDPVLMRWVVVDPLSQQAGGTASLEFTRTIDWDCYGDEVSVSSGGHTDYTYNIGVGAVTRATTETQSKSACALEYACEMYDTTTEAWVAVSDPPINSCSSGGVEYEVTTAQASGF